MEHPLDVGGQQQIEEQPRVDDGREAPGSGQAVKHLCHRCIGLDRRVMDLGAEFGGDVVEVLPVLGIELPMVEVETMSARWRVVRQTERMVA